MGILCYRCKQPVNGGGCSCKDGITLVHGDCREVLPRLEPGSFDAVITDPPYEMGIDRIPIGGKGVAKRYTESRSIGNPWPVEWGWIRQCFSGNPQHCVVFCGYRDIGNVHSALSEFGTIGAVFTWVKRNAPCMLRPIPRLDTEFIIWARRSTATCGDMGEFRSCVLDIPMAFAGIGGGERIRQFHNGPASHPTQKPLAVVTPFISRLPVRNILDPFAGSGTTLVAAKLLGRRAIGIEIEEKYVKICVERLRQSVLI